MVIAADSDKAMEGQDLGGNPGLIKAWQTAEAAGGGAHGAFFLFPKRNSRLDSSDSDGTWPATDEVRAATVAKELGAALVKALERALHRHPALDVDGNTVLPPSERGR